MPLQYYAKFRARVLADIESGDETVSEAIGGVRAAVNDKLEDLSFDSLGKRRDFWHFMRNLQGAVSTMMPDAQAKQQKTF